VDFILGLAARFGVADSGIAAECSDLTLILTAAAFAMDGFAWKLIRLDCGTQQHRLGHKNQI